MVRTTKPIKRGNKVGRKSPFTEEMIYQAYQLSLLGAENKDLARFFRVCEATIWNWRQHSPEFDEAIKNGKDIADANVTESLYRRAMGYEVTEEHITKRNLPEGEIITNTRTVKKQIAPDVTAIIFWLKNRRKDLWADIQKFDLTLKAPLDLSQFSEEEKQILRGAALKRLNQFTSANNN